MSKAMFKPLPGELERYRVRKGWTQVQLDAFVVAKAGTKE